MVRTHKLKTHPRYFIAVEVGIKNFECRYNDRNFKNTDILILQEYNPETQQYTGKELKVVVTYILNDFEGLKDGFIILGIQLSND